MMLDRQLMVSDSQVLAASGNSTDFIDFSAARNLGGGERIYPYLAVEAKSGTAPTLRAVMVGADDEAFSVGRVNIYDTGVQTDPPLGFIRMAVPSHPPKRYVRFEYTLGGTTPSFTVTAGLALSEQTAGM
jgi:hypothetical protein